MIHSRRIVALVLGALVIAGLIPDTLSAQKPRTESITISARNTNMLPFVLPAEPVFPTPLYVPQANKEELGESASPTSAPVAPEPPHPYESLEIYIHIPPDAAKYQPLRVLFVLHGMGGRGPAFSSSLVAVAEKYHWLLIGPTLPYTDYMNTTTLLSEDIRFTGMLADMMNSLPKKLGLKLRQHALVYGFSRGAQLAHRFGIFYPERVESVAAISAGSFTLPSANKGNGTGSTSLNMPYGISDLELYLGHVLNAAELKKVSFLIEVGENDTEPNDVPRQFDPYVGKTRVDRARAFENELEKDGINAKLIIFPDTAHQLTNDMVTTAMQFLRDEELRKKLND
jgi:predicted esterase